MAIDILGKLNTGGSGIDLVALASDLAEASFAPRRARLEARIDRAELSLGALDRVGAQMARLADTLAAGRAIDTTRASSSQPALAVTLSDPKLAPRAPVAVEVLALAQSQVLEFGGFSGPDAALGGGTLVVDTGAWTGEPPVFAADPARSGARLTVPAGATLQDLAEALSALPGVTARPIPVGDGSWSLGVLSDTGAANALRITALPGAAPDIAALDFSADPRPVERRIASNALLTVDGIPVGRPGNTVDDLVPGLTLELTGLTAGPATVAAEPDADAALAVMEGLVSEVNALKSLLAQVTARGGNGAKPGDLAGDPAIPALARGLDDLLSGGLAGFGAAPLFLSELGLRTERDGRLTLDARAFTAAFSADPGRFRAVLEDSLTGAGPGVELAGLPRAGATPGQQDFRRDPVTGAAFLGDIRLGAPQRLDDGRSAYAVTAGPLRGITITVAPGVTEARIGYGQSLASRLSDWIDAATAGDGALGRRQDQLSDAIARDGTAQETLARQQTEAETRSRARFAEMEQVITRLNATGDYIQNLIDSFNAQNR